MSDVAILHIHGNQQWCVETDTADCGELPLLVKEFKQAGAAIYVTVHDYQFLHPSSRMPKDLHTRLATRQDLKNTMDLFALADKVIFPSAEILAHYKSEFKRLGKLVMNKLSINAYVAQHMDTLPYYDFVCIPAQKPSEDKIAKLGIALISEMHMPEEVELFHRMAKFLGHHAQIGDKHVNLKYHMFGSYLNIDHDFVLSDATFEKTPLAAELVSMHDKALENKILEDTAQTKVQVLVHLSTYPLAHSYKLNKMINSGLPVVYLTAGMLSNRLGSHGNHSKYFPVPKNVASSAFLNKQVLNAVEFVINAPAGATTLASQKHNADVQPSRWYLSNYPARRAGRY